MASADSSRLVSLEECLALPPRVRVAWAARVWGQVVECYSPQFRKRYLQDKAIDLAWQFVESGACNMAAVAKAMAAIQNRYGQAEDEDYSEDPVVPGAQLLMEVLTKKGQPALHVVDHAALAFESHQYYRQGLCPFDPVLNSFNLELPDPVLVMARTLYNQLARQANVPLTRADFPNVPLASTLEEVPGELLAAKTTKPPKHEIKHVQERYGG